ncbi:lipocalin family protein [Epilithonimonas mollis]|uniref:Lipocalin-like domain-containing protein n=1 Tax=Epilithonimonas mollis TaxID=216903 RepID=A0A1M6P333_9FLAO|nr:lipocalin family protein [Epilithonimonas mollis]SHK02351.1 Lipocalin-like domain-containing protein [Epilithonimonas mollis]
MKKLILTAISLVAISCSSDNNDDLPQPIENQIIGKWKLKTTTVLSGKDKTTVLNEYLPDACKQKSTYEFTDKKYIMNDYNSIGSECVLGSTTVDYTYNANDKTLKIGNETASVTELTSSTLVVLAFDDYDHNNDGVKDYLKYLYTK